MNMVVLFLVVRFFVPVFSFNHIKVILRLFLVQPMCRFHRSRHGQKLPGFQSFPEQTDP